MTQEFKIGDVVQLKEHHKRTTLDHYATTPGKEQSFQVFSNPMVVVEVLPGDCVFIYPDYHAAYRGRKFQWPHSYLELVSAPATTQTAKTCQCTIRTLMITGCQCQGI